MMIEKVDEKFGCRPSILKAEVTDAMWADFGRLVHSRIVGGDDFTEALTRANLKANSMREVAAMARAYILTGTRP